MNNLGFFRGVLAISFVAAVGCADANAPDEHVEGTKPELAATPRPSVCSIAQERDELVITFSKIPSWNPALKLTQVIRRRDPGADANASDSTSNLWISLGRTEVLKYFVSRGPGPFVDVAMDYRAPFTGVRHALMTSTDGNTGVLTVDGRTSRPFVLKDNPSIVFADGRPAPQLQLNAAMRADLQRLLTESEQEASQCGRRAQTNGAAQSFAGGLASGPIDRGHMSNTWASVPCLGCMGGCDVAWGDCQYHLALASLACGPFAPFCVVGSVAVCAAAVVTCNHICRTSDACCPTDCKSTLFNEACCASGETCLDSNAGLCCSPSKHACNGTACCAANDTCCGSSCCGQSEVCFDASRGLCCGRNNVCGSSCCPSTSVCTNPATSTCCAPDLGQSPCGSLCCSAAEACVSGGCCPLEKACGNACCGKNEVCDANTQACRPSFCPSGQLECASSCCPPDTGCNTNLGACCPEHQIFCTRFNICTPRSQCIQ